MSIVTNETATVEIAELAGHFDEYLAIVRSGKSVVVRADGKDVATLGPPPVASVPVDPNWKPGRLAGRVRMAEDFDAPLPDSFWLGEE